MEKITAQNNKAKTPYLSTGVLAVLAGICTAIGGCLFLGIENKVIGAFFFTFGLFAICTRDYNLFTGKVGYALDNSPSYIIDLAVIWVGNLIGTNLVAALISLTRHNDAFSSKAAEICEVKLSDNLLSIFILSVFCNILMYIAVDGFKKNPHDVGKYIGFFLCVGGFILAGFEHCIANMFYFGLAGVWGTKSVIWLIVMTLGNTVGGLVIPFITRFSDR